MKALTVASRVTTSLFTAAMVAASIFSFGFSSSALAAAPTTVDFSKINLEGLQVLNTDGMDTFGYLIKPLAKPSRALTATLESESNSQIVSPVFELSQVSSSKNIYVYIGKKSDGVFELVIARQNSSGSFFIIDMDIHDATKSQLTMQHGPSDSIEIFKATRLKGDLLP